MTKPAPVRTAKPAVTLRAKTAMPDWSAIASEPAAAVLEAIFGMFGKGDRLAGIDEAEDRVWRAIQEIFAYSDLPPTTPAIAAATRLDGNTVRQALQRLRTRDLIVVDSETGDIRGAYPFTLVPTEHRVTLGGRERLAMCAIDALGIGAMCRMDTVVNSACRHCKAKIAVRTEQDGRALSAVSPHGAVVWAGLEYADECAATSLCRVLAFFCSDAHLDLWRRENDARHGYRLSMAEGLQVGRAIFAPILADAPPLTAAAAARA
ncbi:MAG: alkylmercury lyase family protein [Rhodospirillales bacterium]|nr:alkylmercury lyase family protein [Rhodospirillales bacterium]